MCYYWRYYSDKQKQSILDRKPWEEILFKRKHVSNEIREITTANQNLSEYERDSKQANCLRRGKTHVTKLLFS